MHSNEGKRQTSSCPISCCCDCPCSGSLTFGGQIVYIKEGKGKLALFYTASNVLLTPLLFIFYFPPPSHFVFPFPPHFCFPSSSSSSSSSSSFLFSLLLLLIFIVFPPPPPPPPHFYCFPSSSSSSFLLFFLVLSHWKF